MDLNCGRVPVGQEVSETSGPATPEKSITMKRTVISVINGQGIPAFESLMDVPVALLAALSEKSGSSSPDRSNNSSFAPITPGNKKSVQHCNPQDVGHLVSGDLNNNERPEMSNKVQTEPIGEQMKLGLDNGLVAPPTPYKTALFQHANSSLKGASPQYMESGEDVETQGINLNKTPKQNVKRKKHRPKVIKEGKPTKSMQPITPITGENKEKLIPKRTYVRKKKTLNSLESPSPCITEENKEKPNPLKTYARKRKALNSSENPSDRIVEITAPSSSRNVKTIDELLKSSTKSVRRSLNFNSEDEATSSCHVTTNSGVESELWETLHGSKTVCSAELKVELTEGLGVIATKSPVGVAFDLNRSLNQVLDKHIKFPVDSNPAPSAASFGREIDVSEHLKGPIRTIDAENNMDMQGDHDMVNPTSHPDVIVIDDGTQKSGIKEDCDRIKSSQDSSESPGDVCFVGAYNDPKRSSLFEKISGLYPYLPVIHKKRRTERVHTVGYDKALLPKLPRCLTFADAQRPETVVSRLQQSELMIAFDPTQRPTRKRSKLSTHARKPTYIACAEDCIHLLGSGGTTKGSHVRTESRNCVPPACPPACMDALFADTRFKITTKKRRKKGHFRLISSASSDIKQEYRVASSKLCFLRQPFVLGLTASQWKNLNELQDFHRRGSNVRTYFHANFQPQAVVPYMDPYMDPVEVIAEKMRNMKISREHTRHADEAKNALIPYWGRNMMVPYGRFLDIGKKQRPRAKVDLDPETNRAWNLLMGKKNNVETDEVDMDKEKWWEEEREVFRGRADAFIARMHLILGDRRFSKWKGSVVDSVVGVFLTQNVSDHLSSSAFMSLAARFPLWSRRNSDEGNDKKPDAENVNTSKKQGDGRIMQAFTVNGQQKMLKAIYVSSTGPYAEGKETADVSCSFGRNKGNEIGYSKGKCLQFQGRDREVCSEAPQNRMQTSVLAMRVKSLEESEDRMTSGDVFLTQDSVSSLEDLLKYQIQTAGKVGICSEAVSMAEDLVIRSKQNSSDSPTSFIEHTHDGEIRSHESYATNVGGRLSADNIGASDQEVACMKIKKRVALADKLCGLSGTCLSVNTSNVRANHVQHFFEDTSPSSMPRCTQSSISTGPLGTANADKVLGVGRFVPSASLEITKTYDMNIIERTGTGQGMLLNSVSAMATESHVARNQLHLQMSACAETQQCVEKHVGCHGSLTTRKIERSLKDVSHKLSYAFDEQSVEVQPEERNAYFPAEKTCQEVEILAETQHCGEQKESLRSCNDLKETPETAKAVQLDLKNEGCCLEDWQPQNGESSLRSNKVNAETGKKKTFDWEDLRKEAFANGADNERTSETMDSLDWEAVRNADVNDISKTIRERGMNNVLAQRIKDFLNRLVKDHGSIDLEWLRNIPPDKAKDYLLSIRGLGLKSVECVRLLTLHHLAFPVDTNVGRICVRLGWVPLQPLPESLQLHLLELYPMLEHIQKYLWPRLCTLDQRTLYELHYQMITFGKVFCTKTKPNCNACPMRGECKHFASAFASARLALPGPEEKRLVSSRAPSSIDNDRSGDFRSIPLRQLEGIQPAQGSVNVDCEPIVEEPASPVDECVQTLESDIEDAFYEDSEEIPTIRLSSEEFKKNLMHFMQENNTEIQDEDMSKALVAITAEAASIPMPKLKNVSRLRTEHQVYELPDAHPLLKGMDHRIPDDPCPYLLAIWTPGETAQSTEPPESCCNFQDSAKLCDRKTCFACNSKREAQAQTVRGTILIPCRTAMKGSFPLNGTYFQVNEVFADHSSSCMPIDVPTKWIWNLPRRTVFFGTSIPTIFKGLTMEGIQHCFWRGFVCVRGFDRVSRAPKPLYARLHFPPSKAVQNKKAALKEQGNNTSSGI